jgi:P4 family phage/plasmid primase-like protien
VVVVEGQAPARSSPSGEPSPPNDPNPTSSSSGGGFIKHNIKDGLVVVALTPALKVRVEVLRRSEGDPVGGVLDGLRLEELERAQGYKYHIYAFRTSGECLEVESSRFRVWCRDLSQYLEPGVIGPAVFEVEGLLERLSGYYADPARVKVWVDRLLELDRELSEVESRIVELITLAEGKPGEAVREAVKSIMSIVCVEGLRTAKDGRPAPLPTYTFDCAKMLESELSIKKWLGRLYILFGGKWLGEPESIEVLQAIMVRTYEARGFHEFNWKYSTFEREVLHILRAKAENAEPVRGVRSGDYIIVWRGKSYELREYNGEFVVHDIIARVRVELLRQARAKGYNAGELALAEAPGLVEILKSWVGEPYWLTLLELIGYTTIVFEYPLHKAFMLLGRGSNGKSTYLRMLKDILGRHNIASIPLQAFTDLDYRFLWASLVGRMANIFADLPRTPLSYTGVFKVLTGEDDLILDRKGKEPIRSYTNYAKMIFSANELPRTMDLTYAFFRRWIIVDFPNVFTEDPAWYDRSITPELRDLALTVGLEAMREVLERGAFTGEVDVRDRWLEESDPIYRFIKDLERLNLARRDPNGNVEDKTLYRIYAEWARAQEVEVLAKAEFTKRLETHGIVKEPIKGYPYYKGIMLLERPDVAVAKIRELLGEREGLEAYQE